MRLQADDARAQAGMDYDYLSLQDAYGKLAGRKGTVAVRDFDGEPGDWWVHGLYLADAVSALGGNERIKISWGRVARGKEFDPVVLSSLDGSERHLIAGMDPNESASKA